MLRPCNTKLCLLTSLGLFAIGAGAHAQTYTQRHVFQGGSDGADVESGLTLMNGLLFGTTYGGGGSAACSGGCGTVFSFDAATGAAKLLHSFRGGVHGGSPAAGLIASGQKLYGTTFGGPVAGNSTVFATNPATGATTNIYVFPNSTNSNADASLLDVAGTLYGTTLYGGPYGAGTAFALNAKTHALDFSYNFHVQNSQDGNNPEGGLIDVGGKLYGTAYGGGTGGCGTIYTLDGKTGAETNIYSFQCGNDGSGPENNLVNVKGTLYGTTDYGGQYSLGTVFAFNTATGTEAVIYAFKGEPDGAIPIGLLAFNGLLYGTTYGGGTANVGTIYVLNPSQGTETILHSFAGGSDGAYPAAPMTNVGGTLYGTTVYGGGNVTNCPGNDGFFVGCGTIFSIKP